MHETEIWRAAQHCIKSYGKGATIHVAMRAGELLAQSELDGAETWRQIIAAI